MSSRSSANGFTLTELLLVVALIGTMAAVALPVMKDMTASIKLSDAARMVVSELQDARIKAVSTNRVFRVRMNCPSAGYIRRVEVLATAVDSSANRCLQSAYPFPAADNDMMTRPNFDGPVRTLPDGRDGDDHDRSVLPGRDRRRSRRRRGPGDRDAR